MKITITNYGLEEALKIINSEDSFRKDVKIKVPGKMNWALRLNIKAMTDRYTLFQEARTDLAQKFTDEGKVEDDHVKPEFIEEWTYAISELLVQENELEITPIKRADFEDLPLSMPEFDFLELMVEEETEE